MIVKHRRGTTQEWQEVDLIPEDGELVIEECDDGTRRCKIGTGYTRFSELPYIDDKTRADLLVEINSVKTYLNTISTSFGKSFSAEFEAIENELNTIKTKCNELTTDYIAKDSDLKTVLDKNLSDAITQLEEEIASVIGYSDKIKAGLQIELANIGAQISVLETSLTSTSTKLANDFSDKYNELTTDYTAKDTELKAILDKNLADAVEHLEDEISTISGQSEESQSSLQTELSEITTQINDLEKDFTTALTNLEQDIGERYNELTTDYIARDANLSNSFDQKLINAVDSLNSDITAIADDSKQTKTDLQTKITGIETQLADIEKTFNSALTNSINTTRDELMVDYTAKDAALKTILEQNLANAVESLNDNIVDITDRSEQIKTDLQIKIANIEAQLAVIEETFNNALTSSINSARAEITADYTAKDSELKDLLEQNLTETSEYLNTKVIALTDQLQEIQTKLPAEVALISTQIATIEKTFNDTLAEHAGTFNRKLSDETARVDSEIERLDSRIDSVVTDFNTQLENVTTNFDSKLSDASSTLSADYNTKITTVDVGITTLDTRLTELSNSFEEKATETDNSITGLSEQLTQINETTASLGTKLSNLTDSIDEQLTAAITEKAAELKVEYSSKIKEVAENLQEVSTEVASRIEDLQEQQSATDSIINRHTDDIQRLDRHFDQLRYNADQLNSQLPKYLDDRFDSLQGDFSAKEALLKATDEELAGALEDLRKETADNLAEALTEPTSRIANLETDLSTLTDDFEKTQDKLADLISTESTARATAITDLRTDFIAADKVITDGLNTKIDEAREELVGLIDSKTSDALNTLDEAIQAKIEQIEQTEQDLANRLEAVSNTNIELTRLDARLSTETSTREAQFSLLDTKDGEIEANLTKLETDLKTELEALKNTSVSQSEGLQKGLQNLDEKISSLTSDTFDKFETIEVALKVGREHAEKAIDMSKIIDERAKEAICESEKANETANTAIKFAEKAIEKAETVLSQAISDTRGICNDLHAQVQQLTDDTIAEIEAKNEQFEKAIGAIIDSADNNITSTIETFENKTLVEAESELANKIQEFSSGLETFKEELKEELNNRVYTCTTDNPTDINGAVENLGITPKHGDILIITDESSGASSTYIYTESEDAEGGWVACSDAELKDNVETLISTAGTLENSFEGFKNEQNIKNNTVDSSINDLNEALADYKKESASSISELNNSLQILRSYVNSLHPIAITWISAPPSYKHFAETKSYEVEWKINRSISDDNKMYIRVDNNYTEVIGVQESGSTEVSYKTEIILGAASSTPNTSSEITVCISDSIDTNPTYSESTTVYNTHYVYCGASDKDLANLSANDIKAFSVSVQTTAVKAAQNYATGDASASKYLYYVVPKTYTQDKTLCCDFGIGTTDFTNQDAQDIVLTYNNNNVNYYIYQITSNKQTGTVKAAFSVK